MEEKPEEARRLARRIAADIVSEEQLRALLVDALVREAATRRDLERLGDRLEERIKRLEERMDRMYVDLNRRLDTLTRWMIGLLATIWATLLAAAIAALKILAGG